MTYRSPVRDCHCHRGPAGKGHSDQNNRADDVGNDRAEKGFLKSVSLKEVEPSLKRLRGEKQKQCLREAPLLFRQQCRLPALFGFPGKARQSKP